MKEIGPFVFPERGTDEHLTWQPTIAHVALDRCVLAVARTRIEGTWSAYIAAVEGQNHRAEVEGVLDRGAKLDEAVARAIFGWFVNVPYAR